MPLTLAEHTGGAGCKSLLSTQTGDQIDQLGVASGVAQFLKGPITSISKLIEAPEQTLITVSNTDRSCFITLIAYLFPPCRPSIDLFMPVTCLTSIIISADGDRIAPIVGYLKYGTRNLYFYYKNGEVEERMTLCLLDFYVSEELQRSGVGLLLFQRFLTLSNTSDPCKVAYDRPSPKLLAFLAKHFNMKNPDAQPNKYTIYMGFL